MNEAKYFKLMNSIAKKIVKKTNRDEYSSYDLIHEYIEELNLDQDLMFNDISNCIYDLTN